VVTYLYVALGGSIGALLRYLLSGWVQQAAGGLFPWGTLAVNVLGSFFLGFLYEAALSGAVSPELRVFLAIGLLGSFTTFSTLSYETLAFLRDGAVGWALFYALGSLVLGVLAALFGVWLGGR